MASGKKESEAFNMLKFMYQDDDDEGDQDEPELQGQQLQSDLDLEQQEPNGADSEVHQLDASNLRLPMPQAENPRRERPAIVDYGQDEVAMSLEAEEGEILGNGRLRGDHDAKNVNGLLVPYRLQQ